MSIDMDRTTGKSFDKEPARKCKACHRVFGVTTDQARKNAKIRCSFCGCSLTEPFQRTTAKLPAEA